MVEFTLTEEQENLRALAHDFAEKAIRQLYEGTSQIQRLVIARETLLPRRIEEPAETELPAAA
jgi:hypothetical protein